MNLPKQAEADQSIIDENELLSPLLDESRWVIDNLPFGVFSISKIEDDLILSLTNRFFEEISHDHLFNWQGSSLLNITDNKFGNILLEKSRLALETQKFVTFEFNFGEHLSEKKLSMHSDPQDYRG